MDIMITKTNTPAEMPPEDKLGFGKIFTDHMLVVDYDDKQGWHDARILPFGRISLHPASTVLHYGAEIFEGLKAYRRADGGVQLFRPMENIKRMNNSAERMSLPQMNEEDMLQLLTTFVKLEERWVPKNVWYVLVSASVYVWQRRSAWRTRGKKRYVYDYCVA